MSEIEKTIAARPAECCALLRSIFLLLYAVNPSFVYHSMLVLPALALPKFTRRSTTEAAMGFFDLRLIGSRSLPTAFRMPGRLAGVMRRVSSLGRGARRDVECLSSFEPRRSMYFHMRVLWDYLALSTANCLASASFDFTQQPRQPHDDSTSPEVRDRAYFPHFPIPHCSSFFDSSTTPLQLNQMLAKRQIA
ncbi:hypothetical protein BKA93DRAFT_748254 [Sparassis latifolia]